MNVTKRDDSTHRRFDCHFRFGFLPPPCCVELADLPLIADHHLLEMRHEPLFQGRFIVQFRRQPQQVHVLHLQTQQNVTLTVTKRDVKYGPSLQPPHRRPRGVLWPEKCEYVARHLSRFPWPLFQPAA